MKREKHRAAIALPGAFSVCVGRGTAGMSGHAPAGVGRMAAAPPSGKECERGLAFLPR